MLSYFFVSDRNFSSEFDIFSFFLNRQKIENINMIEPVNKYKKEYGINNEKNKRESPEKNKFLNCFFDKITFFDI